MPRFNFAASAASATQTTQSQTTQSLATEAATVVSTENSKPKTQNSTISQAQKAIAKITELQTTGALVVHTYMDEERDEARIQFTSSETDAEGLKKAAHWLSALNADWVFEGTGKERTAKSANLPSVVMTDPEAAESAHEAARAKWDARKARSEEYKAKKAAEQNQTPQPTLGGANPTTGTNGSVGRSFTEVQVRDLLKKANATLTAELIDLLIKTA